MRLFIVIANTIAAIVSVIWLWGHSTTPANDWEFWFAFSYTAVALGNLAYLFGWGQRRLRESFQAGRPQFESASKISPEQSK